MELLERSTDAVGGEATSGAGGGTESNVGDESVHENTDGTPTIAASRENSSASASYMGKAKHWWSQNISMVRDHTLDGSTGGDPRDYLALERTYLGWFRTSSAVVTLGVVTTQLFLLKDVDRTKGKILGATLAAGGIATNIVGCERYFRQQRLLATGRTLSGGFYNIVMVTLQALIILTLFVIVLVEI